MTKKYKAHEPPAPSSEQIQQRIAETEIQLPGLEEAATELADIALSDPSRESDSLAAARAVADAKLRLEQLNRALIRAKVREAEKLLVAQTQLREVQAKNFQIRMGNLSRHADEFAAAAEVMFEAWQKMLDEAAKADSFMPAEFKSANSIGNALKANKLRDACERHLYKLGGTGNAAMVTSQGQRQFHYPGAGVLPYGLSLTAKSNPTESQSLQDYLKQISRAAGVKKPLGSPSSVESVPAATDASEPETASPAPAAVESESFSPAYEAELRRMKGQVAKPADDYSTDFRNPKE